MRLSSICHEIALRFSNRDCSYPAFLWRAACNRLWYRREKRIYVYPVHLISRLPNPRPLKRDCPDDLRYYERTVSWQSSPDAYRAEAAARLARGEHLYTLVEDNRLAHYAWLIPHQERGEDIAVGQVFFPPPASAALYDHYTHPLDRGRGLYFRALCQLMHDVPTLTKAKHIIIFVYADNAPSRHVIEKVGFSYAGSLVQERRLWSVRRYAVSGGGEFRTAFL